MAKIYWANITWNKPVVARLYVCVYVCMFNYVWPFANPWTVVDEVLLSVGFSRLEYWSGLLCPSPEDLPDPGIEPTSLTSPALAGRLFTTSDTTWELYFLEKHRSWMSAKLDFRCPKRSTPAFQGFTQTADTLQKLKPHWREIFSLSLLFITVLIFASGCYNKIWPWNFSGNK